jgi:hypothetical protein
LIRCAIRYRDFNRSQGNCTAFRDRNYQNSPVCGIVVDDENTNHFVATEKVAQREKLKALTKPKG